MTETQALVASPGRTLIEHNGRLIDADTGEIIDAQENVVGDILDSEFPDGPTASRPDFVVRTNPEADWVLQCYQEVDSEIDRLQRLKKARIEQIDLMIKEQARRRRWLDRRFLTDLQQFAERALAVARKKSILLTFGTLGFRKGHSGYVVNDPVLAVEWAKTYAPDAVKVTESLLVSKLPDDPMCLEHAPYRAIAYKRGTDSFYLKTGIGADTAGED